MQDKKIIDMKYFFDFSSKKDTLDFVEINNLFYEIGSFKGITRFQNEKPYKIFFENCIKTTNSLSIESIEKAISLLISLKKRKGRLFILGVGGSAGHASHAVNDFRKLCDIESYSASDNISELTARVNDEGWDTSYVKWLKTSQLSKKDTLLFSQ